MKISDYQFLLVDTKLRFRNELKGWAFEFSTGLRQYGLCDYDRRRITLSIEFVSHNDESLVRDVLLHEIAHALVGSNHGHDDVWRARAWSIGCSGSRLCYGASIPFPHWSRCTRCGELVGLHKPLRPNMYHEGCGRSARLVASEGPVVAKNL